MSVSKIKTAYQSSQHFKSCGALLAIMQFLTDNERLNIQLICKYYYDVVIPMYCNFWELKNSKDKMWHFIDYYMFEFNLQEIDEGKFQMYKVHKPKNYEHFNNFNKWKYARCINPYYQNCLIIIGGDQNDGKQKSKTNQVLKYDLLTNTFSNLNPMKQARSCFATLNNIKEHKITVFGGMVSDEETTNCVEEYDIKSNYWSSLPSLNYDHANPLVVHISDFIY